MTSDEHKRYVEALAQQLYVQNKMSQDKFIKNLHVEIQSLESKNRVLREALETLRVAVNDKQPDPGAVAFIDRALARAEEIRNAK